MLFDIHACGVLHHTTAMNENTTKKNAHASVCCQIFTRMT